MVMKTILRDIDFINNVSFFFHPQILESGKKIKISSIFLTVNGILFLLIDYETKGSATAENKFETLFGHVCSCSVNDLFEIIKMSSISMRKVIIVIQKI